ncbi:MAG: outer membrane beta-barrel protein [Chitinophagaceae bacterium]
MWSDEFDKKINEAAENHLPPFQDEDWSKMNVLLDKHLPEEKKKRRFMPLLFLLLGGFSMLIILTTYKQAPLESFRNKGNGHVPDITEKTSVPVRTEQNNNSIAAEPGNHYPTGHSSDNPQRPALSGIKVSKEKRTVTTVKKITRKHYREAVTPTVWPEVEKTYTDTTSATENTVANQPLNNNPILSDDKQPVTDSVQQTTEEKKEDEPQPAVPEAKKPGNGKGAGWQISFSTGPDLSLVGTGKTGNWKMQYGVGIGYSINERVQIRTGFMVSRKLYYADSSDYHPPKGFWDYYPNLQKIDANCLVYEIPLNVVYSFAPAKKHQWFVSGGLSSYLMKEETYEYYYKDPSGQDRYRERTIKNENDHILSILQISGGYQYKLNDKLSLMAEPYMKLPLGGVGFGKVKLNNTGVLFTVGYKPFTKKVK